MKRTTLMRRVGVATALLAACALLLPAAALAVTKTPFKSVEKAMIVNPGTWISDGKTAYITGMVFNGVEDATDPRISGQEVFTADGMWDLATGARKLWGKYHLENAGGAWDGYWYMDSAITTSVCTIVGSGGYEGRVAQFHWAKTHWEGYVVENGPGEVPINVKGARVEQFEWIVGDVLNPATMQPTGESAMVGKVTLIKGGGLLSHAGRFTDELELGFVTFVGPTTAASTAMGVMKAANGDLLNWVASGEADLVSGIADVKVKWVGGTGRFEATTGSFEGDIFEVIDPATGVGTYDYKVQGTVRY